MKTQISEKTRQLIDALKATCATYGLGNDGNEYKIITQVFLYKFLNDKFGYELKHIEEESIRNRFTKAEKWDDEYIKLSDDEIENVFCFLDPSTPKLKPIHLISFVWNQQVKGDFSTLFDNTMVDIAAYNADIFSMKTASETQLALFEPITVYVPDTNQRDDFARALVSRLAEFSFEEVFVQKYDFFAAVFEYLIKDYNKDGGGKYAEYYTPHAVASIMAKLLVPNNEKLRSISCYDPSAGTGTLLMALAHAVGEDRCSIYSQDISQKSSKMLRLNLILNGLVLSLPNVIQGDTLVSPYHRKKDGTLEQFDFIISNPPFKLDFSDTRVKIAADNIRFSDGVPNVPAKDKTKMAIYLCFIQHAIYSLKDNGKAAIVVPTGFLTAKSGIEKAIIKRIVDDKIFAGAISMPSNIFATTGTNVSILFLEKSKLKDKVVLMDASSLGETYKEGNSQKTRLSALEINKIIDTFHHQTPIDDFSVVVSYDEIKEKGYSLSAGQYFDIKIEYTDITPEEFQTKMTTHKQTLTELFAESNRLDEEIMKQLGGLGL